MPSWVLKTLVTFLFGIVLSLVAWSWKGMAADVGKAQQDISEMQKVITKIEAYQEVDKAQQEQQTIILQKMLENMEKEKAAGEQNQ